MSSRSPDFTPWVRVQLVLAAPDVESAVVVRPQADVGLQHLMAATPDGRLIDVDEADHLLDPGVRRHHPERAFDHQVAVQLQSGRLVLGKASVPPSATRTLCARAVSTVTVRPPEMVTASSGPGTLPPHVPGSDHAPEADAATSAWAGDAMTSNKASAASAPSHDLVILRLTPPARSGQLVHSIECVRLEAPLAVAPGTRVHGTGADREVGAALQPGAVDADSLRRWTPPASGAFNLRQEPVGSQLSLGPFRCGPQLNSRLVEHSLWVPEGTPGWHPYCVAHSGGGEAGTVFQLEA